MEEQSMRGEGGGMTVPEVQEEVEGAGGREPGPQTLAWPECLPVWSRGRLRREVNVKGGGAFPLSPT